MIPSDSNIHEIMKPQNIPSSISTIQYIYDMYIHFIA
jgi:hypothetical protein